MLGKYWKHTHTTPHTRDTPLQVVCKFTSTGSTSDSFCQSLRSSKETQRLLLWLSFVLLSCIGKPGSSTTTPGFFEGLNYKPDGQVRWAACRCGSCRWRRRRQRDWKERALFVPAPVLSSCSPTSLFCFDPGSRWAQQSLVRREKPTILHTFAFSAVYFTKTFKPVSESVSSPVSVVIISLLKR